MRPRTIIPILALCAVLLAEPFGCRNLSQALEAYGEVAHRVWNFNGTIAVARGNQVLFSHGYGYADALFRDPNTPQTKFFVGSVTKQFTAAAILLLEERKQLSLDDPVSRYLTDYPIDPGNRITIRHLLTHTSGLPNYTDAPELILNRTIEIAPADIVASFKDLPLEFEPGTNFKYSNSGYILLGEIIEAISGQSYEAFLHKELLKPLGMLNSGYGRREMGHPNRAEGYTIDPEGRLIGAVPIHFSILHSAGALYTTADDMLKWNAGLRDGRVLSPASVAQMMSPQTASYGYGWWVENRYGRMHAFHDGFLDGFNCTFDRWADDDLTVLVFSNEDDAPVQKIARGLAAIAFGRRPVIPVEKTAIAMPPENLAAYEGVFRSVDSVMRFVVVENDTLHTFLSGQDSKHLCAEAPDHFYFADDNTETIEFRRNDSGTVIELDYSDGEEHWRFRRADQSVPHLPTDNHDSHGSPSVTLRDYLGDYALDADSTGASAAPRITVALCGDHLCAVTGGNNPVVLLGRDGDRFYQPASGFVIEFVRDSASNVSGCIIELSGEQVTGRRVSFPEQ